MLGGFFGGLARGARGISGPMSTASGAWGQAAGSFGRKLGGGGFGATATGAAYGGLAGGLWGMASGDTSVLGGMAMGAGMGAIGGRYGSAAVAGAKNYMGPKGNKAVSYQGLYQNALAGVQGQLGKDWKGAKMATNRAANTIKGLARSFNPLRGAGGGMP